MAIRMNLWTLTLLPGKPVPMYIRRDFQITNAALGEELRSKDGRSVVKVTHTPAIPGSMEYDSDDDHMPDFDEDSDDDDEEGLEGEDEESSDDDDEEGDEEDSDEDSDDDSDFDDYFQETAVVCSLTAGKTEQTTLDLTFVQGDVVIFEVTGENAVHLIGNYINQWPIDEDEEHDDYDDLDLDDEDDEDEVDEFSLEELSEDEIEAPVGKITTIEEPKVQKKSDKKRKAQESDEDEAPVVEQLSKSQKKKLAKKAKLEASAAAAPAPAPAPKKEEPKESKKKTLPSGLVIEDVKIGTGAVAKPGKRLGMRYVGKLTNGKQFDANTGGAPFRFVLGRGEVIAGWDQGLNGMAIGGERRLTVPPKLAYGNQKIPGIPPNSTLVFDVKLISIN